MVRHAGRRRLAVCRAGSIRILARLLADRAGNAMAIVTLTMFMVITLAGLGTDMSRAYLAKTSLQNACDAGVLAGRKAMAATGAYSTTETAKAVKMFNFNYHKGETETQTPTFTSSADTTGHVNGTATTTMPTTLMKLFGYTSLPLSVNCSAELQMANADVMFVLDTTGSMADNADGTGCTGTCTTSKIAGLRSAIRSFYTTVAGAVTDKANTRIRFGFVPYAMTVNATNLISSGVLPTNNFVDSWPYQSKLVKFSTTPTYIGTPGAPVNSTETYGSAITQSDCTNYQKNAYPTAGSNPVNSGTAPANTTSTTYSAKSWTATKSGSTTGTCVRNKSVVTTTYVTRYLATSYRYIQDTYDVRPFKAYDTSAKTFPGFNAVPVATGITLYDGCCNAATASYVSNQPSSANPFYDIRDLATGTTATGTIGNVSTSNTTWGGCIEERSTQPNLTWTTIPANAYDMDLTNAPNTSNDATRWRPYLADLEYWRGSYTTSVDTTTATSTQTNYCPQPMMQFTTVDTNDPKTVPSWLDSYVNTLVPNGGTYHDIGMMWGARLGNPLGMFSANVNAGNLPSVSRHIIFMTDGTMQNYPSNYTAWGVTQYDGRDAPTSTADTTLVNYHNNRFLAACTMAKNMGYTIWVIGFGQTLTTQMKSCATANRAYYASDTSALTTTFQYIAGQVADLRINK